MSYRPRHGRAHATSYVCHPVRGHARRRARVLRAVGDAAAATDRAARAGSPQPAQPTPDHASPQCSRRRIRRRPQPEPATPPADPTPPQPLLIANPPRPAARRARVARREDEGRLRGARQRRSARPARCATRRRRRSTPARRHRDDQPITMVTQHEGTCIVERDAAEVPAATRSATRRVRRRCTCPK